MSTVEYKGKKLNILYTGGDVLPSELARVDIKSEDSEYSVIVEYLASHGEVVIDFVYPDGDRIRHENIIVDQEAWQKMADMRTHHG